MRAEVIDFKTDQIEPAQLDERAELYRPQLEAYARVAAKLLGLRVEDVAVRTLFLALDCVRP